MTWILWILGVATFVGLCFFSFGLYEFIVEEKHESKRMNLHLKRLDDINHDRK